MDFIKADNLLCSQLVEMRILYLTEDHGELSQDETQRIRASLPQYYDKHLNKDLFVFAAMDNNDIVSCCFLLVTEKPANPDFINGRTGSVLNVYTKPEYRHRGCAKRLMELLLDEARKLELDFVELKATEDGYGLYKAVGFKDSVSKYHNMKYIL